MGNYLGDFQEDSIVNIHFTTHATDGSLVAPSSNFTPSDFRIIKDGSTIERQTMDGVNLVSPFKSTTGRHLFQVDTSDDTGDAGFWEAGHDYRVEIESSKTVAGANQTGVEIGAFSIENRYAGSGGSGGGASAADIADAVWDEARSGHAAAGSFGETMASVQSNIGNLDAAVSGRASQSSVNAIQSAIPSNFAALGINASGHIERVVLCDTTTSNTDMRGTDGANTVEPDSKEEIADQVWDELQSEHTTAGTFGRFLDSAVSGVSTGGVSAADIADAVWDEAQADHTSAGSFGETFATLASNIGNLDAAVSSRASPSDAQSSAAAAIAASGVLVVGVTYKRTNASGDTLTETIQKV